MANTGCGNPISSFLPAKSRDLIWKCCLHAFCNQQRKRQGENSLWLNTRPKCHFQVNVPAALPWLISELSQDPSIRQYCILPSHRCSWSSANKHLAWVFHRMYLLLPLQAHMGGSLPTYFLIDLREHSPGNTRSQICFFLHLYFRLKPNLPSQNIRVLLSAVPAYLEATA